mmetsp:Transcript_49400/g.143718  ORF Transcript_49400/g.143718 Transcript_49400/m.143718 type:complete len:109 (-) Transcript_49400:71-397(-)
MGIGARSPFWCFHTLGGVLAYLFWGTYLENLSSLRCLMSAKALLMLSGIARSETREAIVKKEDPMTAIFDKIRNEADQKKSSDDDTSEDDDQQEEDMTESSSEEKIEL